MEQIVILDSSTGCADIQTLDEKFDDMSTEDICKYFDHNIDNCFVTFVTKAHVFVGDKEIY